MAMDWKRYKSSFFKFEDIGDSISGTVLTVGEADDFNGNPCPKLVIDTDSGPRTVTAGQVMLQAALAEKEPDEGDHITITYYANGEGKPGRAPAKLFKVEVTRKGAQEKVGAADLV